MHDIPTNICMHAPTHILYHLWQAMAVEDGESLESADRPEDFEEGMPLDEGDDAPEPAPAAAGRSLEVEENSKAGVRTSDRLLRLAQIMAEMEELRAARSGRHAEESLA